nr:hypothetical protein [uncultured Mediterranean phage uvMED]
MTLASSGTIAIGGSTANRSINLELGRSATAASSLGETSLRTLAGVSSGAISLSNFHGKSNFLDQQTVTVGYRSYTYDFGSGNVAVNNFYGFTPLINSDRGGSISDGTSNLYSGASISSLYWFETLYSWTSDVKKVTFQVPGTFSNNGWTTMSVAGTNFARTSASFSSSFGFTRWEWSTASNPFGTTVGATKTVTWT